MKHFALLLFLLSAPLVLAQDFLENVNANTFEAAKKYDHLEGVVLDEVVVQQVKWVNTNEVGFYVLEQTVSKLVKINSISGAAKAGFYQPTFNQGTMEESFKLTQANVYFLEKGQVSHNNISKSNMFTSKRESAMTINALDLTGVAPGSIVAYSYVTTSMFIERLPTFYIREDLAKQRTTYALTVPSNLDYQILVQSNIELDQQSAVVDVRGNNNLFGFSSPKERVVQKSFTAQEVSALPFYNYVDNIENYVDKIEVDLVSVTFPRENPTQVLPSMGMFFNDLASNRMFFKQINQKNIFKKKLDFQIFEALSQEQKMHKALQWVTSHVKWNGQLSFLPNGPIKDALSSKAVDSAQINLLLINLLRQIGVQAYPVVISTHENGQKKKWQHNFFNQVIAVVHLDGRPYFLDASNKFSLVNVLDNSSLNLQGYQVFEDGKYQGLTITSPYTSVEKTQFSAYLSTNGSLQGSLQKSYSYNSRVDFLEQYAQQTASRLIKTLSQQKPGFIFSNLSLVDQVDQHNNSVAVVKLQAQNNHGVEHFNGKMFFNPFQMSDLRYNPLNARQREIPVYYGYSLDKEFEVQVELPKNHTIVSLPNKVEKKIDALKVSYTITYNLQDNILSCTAKVSTHMGYIPAKYSAMLYDFYAQLATDLNTLLVIEQQE